MNLDGDGQEKWTLAAMEMDVHGHENWTPWFLFWWSAEQESRCQL
jgi:hypothetical protein